MTSAPFAAEAKELACLVATYMRVTGAALPDGDAGMDVLVDAAVVWHRRQVEGLLVRGPRRDAFLDALSRAAWADARMLAAAIQAGE